MNKFIVLFKQRPVTNSDQDFKEVRTYATLRITVFSLQILNSLGRELYQILDFENNVFRFLNNFYY